jgi:hypothetical protein
VSDWLTPVDGLELPERYRAALLPGETLTDEHGVARTLPRWFYRVESWQAALDTRLSEHFMLWEFIGVDVRETPPLRSFPRYVPCAVLLLATALEAFRQAVGTYVHIAANGGYRSPAHGLTRQASRHCWAAAANIYRIGDDLLHERNVIERYAAVARRTLPGSWIRPWGKDAGMADDHLHIDLGYVSAEPLGPPRQSGAGEE